jgi:hypothetical protein
VLANRSGADVPVRFVPKSGAARQLTIPPDETVPLFLDGKADLTFATRGATKHYALDANCAYFFGRGAGGQVDMQKIGLGEDGTAAEGRKLSGSAARMPTVTIPVKICVDEEEPARDGIWEQRYRRRIESASAILEKHCGVGFRVVSTGKWKSDNRITEFTDSLGELENQVDPAPARVVIGFTSQWRIARGRLHMAGTRGPLHSHILVREGSPEINEPERLEFLVHELGHYLGAAHSPEPISVMRPVLGDNRAGRSDFRIRFDPVNTLAMSMICEEIRRSNITNVSQLQFVTRRRLEQVYREISRTIPEDPAAFRYASLMRTHETPVAISARQVLQRIVSAAMENHSLPTVAIEASKQPARRAGDELTAYLVRAAAQASTSLPEDVAPQAFLLACAIGLDDANAMASVPGLANLVRTVETPSERTIRVTVLGKPTMRGRLDITQHFFAAAYLTATNGADVTQSAFLDLELQRAQRPTGLSFKVVTADRAGSRFGRSLVEKRFPLRMVAAKFEVASYMPSIDALADGITAKDFASKYGAKDDARLRKKLQEIDQSVIVLPAYLATGPTFGK